VAAGPTKVGEYCPKLDDVTSLGGAPPVSVTGAAATPPETKTKPLTTIARKIAIENQINLCLLFVLVNIKLPPKIVPADGRAPHT
jgi:hypothetical protein